MDIFRSALRFFFYHFYHGLSWTYDPVAGLVSIGRWNTWIKAATPYLQGETILEIGFGTGHLQNILADRNLLSFGLDESPQMIRSTASRLRKGDHTARLVRGLAQSLPFTTNRFDSVVSTFPTEYIFDAKSLAEIKRVLKPGGRLVVIPTAWIGGKDLSDRAAAWLFRVTHQAEEITRELQTTIKKPFQEAGFDTSINLVEIAKSTVLVVSGTKPVS